MKVLKSLEELETAGLSPPVYDAAREVLKNLIDAYTEHGCTYNPEDDGYVVVVEGGDEALAAEQVGYVLTEALFEDVLYEQGLFLTCTLHNNQFGISWVVVDSPELDPVLRAKLVAECCEGVPL